MPPVPAPITDDLSVELWQLFIDNKQLPPIMEQKYKNAADKLVKADPAGAILIRAILAGIANDVDKVLAELSKVKKLGMTAPMYCNSIRLLTNVGQVSAAHSFAKEGAKLYPLSKDISELLMPLAYALDDSETLESELSKNKELPTKDLPPTLVMYMLDRKLSGINENDEDAVTSALQGIYNKESTSNEGLSKRMDSLIDNLLEKVDI
jgi:hypothetical protein